MSPSVRIQLLAEDNAKTCAYHLDLSMGLRRWGSVMGKLVGGCLKVIGGVVVLLFVVVLAFSCVGRKGGSTSVSSEPETTQEQQAEPEVDDKTEAEAEQEAQPEPEAEPEPTPEAESSAVDETSIRPEFKEAMDSYEAFFDEYVEVMKAYQEEPTNTELMMRMSDLMAQEADMLAKFDAWESDESMSTAETAYYLEVQSRIYAKLAEVM